jgi:hypothetical protein
MGHGLPLGAGRLRACRLEIDLSLRRSGRSRLVSELTPGRSNVLVLHARCLVPSLRGRQ